jgi:hypothetical protein
LQLALRLYSPLHNRAQERRDHLSAAVERPAASALSD